MEADSGNIVYFSEVIWFSHSEMLNKFYNLQNEILSFVESKGNPITEFENDNWLTI